MKVFGIFLFSFILVSFTFKYVSSRDVSQENPFMRKEMNINQDWSYSSLHTSHLSQIEKKTNEWKSVDLPHTWNRFDATDMIPGYRRDTGWYKKKLFIPEYTGKRFLLHFEAVNMTAKVYVNEQLVGSHVGGYLGFEFDITPYVQKGDTNQIHVCADNSYDPSIIPSQKSDFVLYGGITRDVRLKVVPTTYIKQMHISTPEVSEKSAKTKLNAVIANPEQNKEKVHIKARIKDAKGKVIVKTRKRVLVQQKQKRVQLQFPSLDAPHLWDVDDPYRYTAEMSIKQGKQQIDNFSDQFGYRWFEFKKNGPFYLNGERLLIRGTHRHEEHAGFGGALPDSIHWNDMQRIKNMGANFVRLGHYPQDPDVYEACDSLGLLVWDELPWCRGGMGFGKWKQYTRKMLKEMIDQNYNHPSIIIWSLGNEMPWRPDFPNGGNIDSIRPYVKQLNDIAHQKDPERLTAVRKGYEVSDVVDVFSPSIWSGWYAGVYKSYEKALDDSRDKYDRFIHMEYGGASHFGRHKANPITGDGQLPSDVWSESESRVDVKSISSEGDWSENYMVDLFDWHLHVSEQLDWFSGNAQWALKDFASPLRADNPIPYVNQKGLMDRAGKPKDAYYVFKSYWTESPKFVYIESPTWEYRQGKPKQKSEVCVYSNCDKVELLLNDKSQGIKKRYIDSFPAHGLQWFVPFQKGSNSLQAKGYSDTGDTVSHDISVDYITQEPKNPFRLLLSKKQMDNGHILVQARVTDYDSVICTDFNERIRFTQLSGSGHLKTAYGTPHGSSVIDMANGKAAIEYIPEKEGKAVIGAYSAGVKGKYIRIDTGKRK